MHCRFNEETGDFLMYDSGLLSAPPVRLATHDEIAEFYLHDDMYCNPHEYADLVDWFQSQLMADGGVLIMGPVAKRTL